MVEEEQAEDKRDPDDASVVEERGISIVEEERGAGVVDEQGISVVEDRGTGVELHTEDTEEGMHWRADTEEGARWRVDVEEEQASVGVGK
jgi:hypothetical protein